MAAQVYSRQRPSQIGPTADFDGAAIPPPIFSMGHTFKIFWIIYQFVVDVVKIGVQLPFELSECRSECVENP